MTEIKDNGKGREKKNFQPVSFLKNNILSLPLIKFIIIGLINTAHHTFWNFIFYQVLHLNYMVAYVIAFFLAMTGSFFLNTYITFQTKPTIKKYLEYPITVLPNLLISMFNMKILIEYLKWPNLPSAILASVVAIPITFLLTKFVLTKNDKDKNNNKGSGVTVTDIEGNKVSSDIGEPSAKRPSELLYGKDNSGRAIYNYGRLSKLVPWLDVYDIIIFLLLIGFALLDHGYIFQSKFLYGVKSTDSTVQMIYFLPYLIKDFILGGQTWSWSYGMGGDIFSEFSYYYTTSPIIWLIAPFLKLFPQTIWSLENSLNLKLFISIFKQTIFMFFMYILLRYEKRSRFASFAAAMVYGGGLYYLWTSNYFDFMTDAYIWVPLMVLGMRIFQKKRNFWPLLISASLAVINNYYFGYHTFIFFIFFVIIMIVPEGKTFRDGVKSWFRQFASYGAIGVGALLLSMFAFMPALYAFLKLDRFETVNPVNWIQDKAFFENLPINLFFNNSTIGVPMLIILFLFLNYKRTSNLTDRKVMLLMISLLLYCSPKTGYFLNGNNYYSERWFYLLIFVFAYVTADFIDEMKRPNFFNGWSMALLLIATGTVIFYRWDLINGFDDKDVYMVVLGANLLAFLSIAVRHYVRKIETRKLLDMVVVVMVAVALLFNSRALGNDQALDMNTETIESEKMVSPALDDVMAKVVPNENEFYRTVFRNNTYENAPTYYRYYGISTFSSMTDGPMHDWIKRILNIRHNIVYLSSFMNMDDRAYLEGMLGVRYIVTDKNGYNPPPIYTKVYSNDSYDLFESKNSVGMDMWFTETFPENQIEKIGYAERDLQLLNYAVTEKQIEGIAEGKLVESEHIPLNDSTMLLNGVDLNLDAEGSGKIKFNKGGFVTFKVPKPYDDSQVYLHNYVRPEDKMDFEQTVNEKRIFKSYEHNAYVYYTNDWTWVLNGNEPELVWKNSEKTFDINNMTLSRVDLRNFSDVIAARNKYNMENLHVGKNIVTGTVKNNEKGIMVFNIPYNKGWKLTVNGKPTEIQKMNGFLSGVVLEPGENSLVFKFTPRGLMMGTIITLATFLAALFIHFFLKKKYPFQVNESEGTLQTFNSDDLYTEREENYGIRKVLSDYEKEVREKIRHEVEEEYREKMHHPTNPTSYPLDDLKRNIEKEETESDSEFSEETGNDEISSFLGENPENIPSFIDEELSETYNPDNLNDNFTISELKRPEDILRDSNETEKESTVTDRMDRGVFQSQVSEHDEESVYEEPTEDIKDSSDYESDKDSRL